MLRAPLVACLLALPLARGEADQVELLQKQHDHARKHHDHDHAEAKIQEQLQRLSALVEAALDGDDAERAPKVLELVRSLVSKNEQGEEIIDVAPLAKAVMGAFREGWRQGRPLVDKELARTTQGLADASSGVYAVTEEFIMNAFVKESALTSSMDVSLALMIKDMASTMAQVLKGFMPRLTKLTQGAKMLLQVAEFGANQANIKPMATAARVMNSQVVPAVTTLDRVLDTGLRYSEMVGAHKEAAAGARTLKLQTKAATLLNGYLYKYEDGIVEKVNLLRVAYLKVLQDLHEDLMKTMAKDASAQSLALSTGYSLAAAGVDQAFDYFLNGFRGVIRDFRNEVTRRQIERFSTEDVQALLSKRPRGLEQHGNTSFRELEGQQWCDDSTELQPQPTVEAECKSFCRILGLQEDDAMFNCDGIDWPDGVRECAPFKENQCSCFEEAYFAVRRLKTESSICYVVKSHADLHDEYTGRDRRVHIKRVPWAVLQQLASAECPITCEIGCFEGGHIKDHWTLTPEARARVGR